jgi:hypothetical protein
MGAGWGINAWLNRLAAMPEVVHVTVLSPSGAPATVVAPEPVAETREPAKPKAEARAKTVAAAKPAKPEKREAGGGTVWFRLPEDIEVFWNGEKVDPKKPLYNQTFGKHEIRMVRAGFDPITAQVEVSPAKTTIIRVD